jgi:hypothetical protein
MVRPVKTIHFLFLFLILSMLLFSAIGLATTQVGDAKTSLSIFKNPIYGYKIQYPSNWDKSNITDPRHVAFTSPIKNASTFSYVIIDVSETNESLAEIVNDHLNHRNELVKSEIFDSSPTTLAGLPAHKITETASFGSSTNNVTEIFTVKDKKEYSIIYTASEDNIPNIQKMIDSFKLT